MDKTQKKLFVLFYFRALKSLEYLNFKIQFKKSLHHTEDD